MFEAGNDAARSLLRFYPLPPAIHDAAEVVLHRTLRRVGVVRANCVVNDAMFRESIGGPRRRRQALELKAMGKQAVQHAPRRLVARDPQNLTVELGVGTRKAGHILNRTLLFHVAQNARQAFRVTRIRMLCRVSHNETLQHQAQFNHFQRLCVGNAANARAPIGQAFDEIFLRKPRDRGSNGRPPNAQGRGEVGLHEPLARKKFTGRDRIAQLPVRNVVLMKFRSTPRSPRL